MPRNRKHFHITDHAIVRYFERVLGVNIEEVKRQILPEEDEKALLKLKAIGVVDLGTHKITVVERRIVTVVKDQQVPKPSPMP